MFQLVRERDEAEAALSETQQLLASISDNISEAIYRSTPQHQLTFVNQAYLNLFGYDSLAELQAIPREHLYADAAARAQLLDLLAREGAFRNQEIEYVRRDGTRFWGLTSARILRDPRTDEPSFQVGAITDITLLKLQHAQILELNESLERRIRERTAELSASEARLRTLVDHAPEAIVVFDGETGRFRFGNAHACELFGVTPERLEQLTPAEASPELQPCGRSSAELAREHMRLTLIGATPVFEWVHRHSSGQLIPTEVRLVRLPGEGTNLVRASIIDNTERKRAEQATRESEAKYRALFATSGQGVILHDENHYIEVNPTAARILGYDRPEDLIGLNPLDTSPPYQSDGRPTAEVAREHIQRCLSTGSDRFDWIARTILGKHVPLEVILTRIELGGREVIQAVINDITARKQAEAELRKALDREKELVQLKSNFVSMVSHEFRTPLGVIMSSAEILETYYERLDAGERREQLSSITKNTRRMGQLMEEVLLLGSVDAGKLEFKPEQMDLAVFFRRLIDELLVATEERCPIGLQSTLNETTAWADERVLAHIFTNLLSNAVKYSERGSPVSVSLAHAEGKFVCSISDRGVGIPPEDHEWLFKAFHRGRNVRAIPGSGLGLTIVKRCVELHGGTIHIHSQVGQGTTVTVRLPVAPEAK